MTGWGDLARRLLGPAGRDAGCERCFEALDEYVEGELAGQAERRQAAVHVAHDRDPVVLEVEHGDEDDADQHGDERRRDHRREAAE